MMFGGFLRRLPNTSPLTRLASHAQTLVVHSRHDPTVHYYWRSRYPHAVIIDTSCTTPDASRLSGFDQIVIIRHIASDWLSMLDSVRPAQTRIIYFLDDDIPGLFPDGFLAGRYVFRNRYQYLKSLNRLDRVCDAVCVSTPALAERYGLPSYSVVAPLPCESDLPPTDAGRSQTEPRPLIFYHGSGTHLREILWLKPVIERVLRKMPDARFELIGGKRVKRLFADLENVRVIRQMSWEDYLSHCRSKPFDVGLAPLLPARFNLVRSHVKFFDITRCGAAGIYSNRPPFAGNLQSGVNGLLVDDSEDEWINAIVALATDEDLRTRLYRRALDDVKQLITPAQQIVCNHSL